jgi:AraC family transcriptional regulator of adaptative response / DNA-3-methyladenine glycosylase II
MDVLDANTCYRALRTHDARFDGCFFVGVTSTGIYCRPVCRVKLPKQENCRFFVHATTAESEGFRPCLRCRPELAPGSSPMEATYRLARHAKQLVDDGFLCEVRLTDLATHLNISDRQLRRAFQQEFGISLVSYAQTKRLLLAKQLLTETALPVTEVAYASGFESLRRFNALFKERYRLSPSALRSSRISCERSDALTVSVAFRPPFAWKAHLEFLATRAIQGVEFVTNDSYARSVRLLVGTKVIGGWLVVTCDEKRASLRVRVDAGLVPLFPIILGRVKHLFDANCQPDLIEKALGSQLATESGLRLPGSFDGFEMAIRAILGQQVSVKGASTLTGRLVSKFGTLISTPIEGVTHLFPNADTLAKINVEAIQEIGIPHSRANTILGLARAVVADEVRLEPGCDVSDVMRRLEALPGVGPWTAQYIAMRALSWPDAFLSTDLGVLKALGTTSSQRAEEMSHAWKPWRSYAVMHLWRKLGTLEKENKDRTKKGERK